MIMGFIKFNQFALGIEILFGSVGCSDKWFQGWNDEPTGDKADQKAHSLPFPFH